MPGGAHLCDMFNRYWREYPWFFQLTQYIIFIFVFASLFGGVIGPLLAPILGGGVKDVVNITATSTQAEVNTVLWIQAFGHFGMFMFPAVLFAYLMHPRPTEYLGLRRPGKAIHWPLVVLTTLGALPVILVMGTLMRQIDLGPAANRMHEQTEVVMRRMMDVRTPGEFLARLFVMAILPAIGEELMFRGILMRFAARKARAALFPILITAVMFALFHFNNPYALLPIFLMGIFMALLYYWTGSLLCSIVAHFLFNGTQIFIYYLANSSPAVKAFVDKDELSPIWLGISAAIFFIGIILLWRNRTSLPQPAWTNNFSAEELAERESQKQRLEL
jgi:membrane protease YdiL (CAAX protease family)